MQLQQFLLLTAVLASTVTANPLSLNERQVQDTCDARRLACGSAPGANQSLCAVQKNACDACEAAYEAYITSPGSNKSYAAAFRAECFTESAIGTGEGVGPLITSLSGATTGYPTTTSTSTSSTVTPSAPVATATADTCDARRLACGSAPGANQSLCAVQKNACDACESAYEAYITSPGSNKSYAAAFRAQCFTESAVGTGDGVVPLIAALSAAGTTAPATSSTIPLSTAPTASSTRYSNTSSEATATTSTAILPTSTPAGSAAGNATSTFVGFTTTTSLGNPTSGNTGPKPTSSPVYTGAAAVVRPAAFGLFVLGAAAFL